MHPRCSVVLPIGRGPGTVVLVAELEEHAFRRDRGFVVKLVVIVLAGSLVGAFLFGQLTQDNLGGCLARTFFGSDTQQGKSE